MHRKSQMPLTPAQQTGLEAAILAYLAAAEGGRFARTAAAFKEEAQVAGGGESNQGNLAVSGAVLEKAWAHVYDKLMKADVDTALYDAIELGDLAEVQLHVCVGVDVEMLEAWFPEDDERNDGDHDEYREEASPMYWAARFNKLEIVRFYVTHGHNKEEGNSEGETPLYAAARKGHLEVVRYLVEQGANKNTEHDGNSPLSVAASEGRLEVVRYLVEQGVDTTKDAAALEHSSACGYARVVEYLVDVRRVNIDGTTHNGWTALHWAAFGGHLNVAQVLFRYGATLDIKDNHGHTPADIATRNGRHHITNAIRAEEIRRRDHGFKRDPSTIEGTEEHEAAKRPRAEREAAEAAAAAAAAAADESDDDDDDDDDEVDG